MARIIAVVNQKGGVGKTTTVVNLAHALSLRDVRVLAVDTDPQANLTFYMGQDERLLERERRTLYHALLNGRSIADILIEGQPSLVPAGIGLARADVELASEPGSSWVLKEALAPIVDRFDFVLLDCPPTLTLLTVNALATANEVLIPVKTDLLSSLGVPQLFDTISKIKRRANPRLEIMGILPTLFNPSYGHDAEVLAELNDAYGKQVRLFEPIRRSTGFDRAAGSGRATVTATPSSAGAESYRRLAAVILEMKVGS